jgi:hypothetical protein
MGSAYEVRLKGVVSARVLDALRTAREMRADTVLHGEIEDQAALHGLLARISDLGLELVDIHRIQHEAPPQEH